MHDSRQDTSGVDEASPVMTLSDRIQIGIAKNNQSRKEIQRFLKEFKRLGDPTKIGFRLGDENGRFTSLNSEYFDQY